MLKLAFDMLRFNFLRTVMLILVLVIATVTLLVFRGYINYSADGMKQGFVAGSGALQIAHKNFWDSSSEVKTLLRSQEFQLLAGVLENTYGIDSYMRMLTMNGLIGTGKRSHFFSGDAFDTLGRSEVYQFVDIGTNSSLNEDGIILGSGLLEYLDAQINDYVTILGKGQRGIALTALPIAGSISIGNRSANDVIGLMALKTAHRFYNMQDGEFDRMRVDVVDLDQIQNVKKEIELSLSNTDLQVMDWIQLNSTFLEINNLNKAMSFWMTLIFVIFILVSVSQMLQISFMQRLGELGTLRAIGFKPKDIFFLLFDETLLMTTFSVILGIICYFLVSLFTKVFGVTFTPPLSDRSYPLLLMIKWYDILIVGSVIVGVTLLSCIYPVYKAVSKPIIEVIRHV